MRKAGPRRANPMYKAINKIDRTYSDPAARKKALPIDGLTY